MKVITEAILRDELRATEPEIYYIPEGKILSPAAREYLQQRKIKIGKHTDRVSEAPAAVSAVAKTETAAVPEGKPKFICEETGAFFMEKPEHMTHLYGNVLVRKDHPRILFRGKLDSTQALVVFAQTCIHEGGEHEKLIEDLNDILRALREIMRCDVLEQPLVNERIIGLDHKELRERSHNPLQFFNIKQMVLPDYTMGKAYALLNQIRTQIREAEVAANTAFRTGQKCTRPDIIEELNRLSSALHIMMCMYLAGMYK